MKTKPTLKELGIKNIHPLYREPTPNEEMFECMRDSHISEENSNEVAK